MSVSKENTPCKCTKISDESEKDSICITSKNEERLMGKGRNGSSVRSLDGRNEFGIFSLSQRQEIRLRIGEQMDLNTALFNEKLENLRRRVEQIECTKTHEEVAKILLKKVSNLERRINPVIAFQKGVSSKPAVPQSEMKERKLKAIHVKEENHGNGEDFQAISTSSSQNEHLAKDPFCPELAEEVKDPPQNPKPKRGFDVKSGGDCAAMDPSQT